jgi:hypothetical protein
MLEDWFLAHPQGVGESYFEHQRTALRFSLALFQAALACLVHAIVPGLFQSTASRCVAELHDRMMRRTAPATHLLPAASFQSSERKAVTLVHLPEPLGAVGHGSYPAEHEQVV